MAYRPVPKPGAIAEGEEGGGVERREVGTAKVGRHGENLVGRRRWKSTVRARRDGIKEAKRGSLKKRGMDANTALASAITIFYPF